MILWFHSIEGSSDNKQAITKRIPMAIYWLVYLTCNNFIIDVLRKAIINVEDSATRKPKSSRCPQQYRICFVEINIMKHSHRMMDNSKLYCLFSDSEPPSWEHFLAYRTLVVFCNIYLPLPNICWTPSYFFLSLD